MSYTGVSSVTKRKSKMKLDRTPRYVSRETGAAELEISPQTWDRWVKDGKLPPPAPGGSPDAPRWRWEDVDARLSGKPDAANDSPFVKAIEDHYGPQKEERGGLRRGR
jgi:hypothetical protein